MTPPRDLAAADTGPAVVAADDGRADVLSTVIADAFLDLAVSTWLIPDPAARRRIYPGYFGLYVEHALADGIVLTTPDEAAAALWLPAGDEPAARPAGYDQRLAEITGPWADRFRAFDQELDRRHPAGFAHHHLAILAVRPDRQGQGLGTALLRAHHAALDRDGIPAYLEASNMRSRRLYLAHGYQALGGPIILPGAALFPMLRPPCPGGQPGRGHEGGTLSQPRARKSSPLPMGDLNDLHGLYLCPCGFATNGREFFKRHQDEHVAKRAKYLTDVTVSELEEIKHDLETGLSQVEGTTARSMIMEGQLRSINDELARRAG